MATIKNLYTLRVSLFAIALLSCCSLSAQSLNKNWEQELNTMLEKFMTCATSSGDKVQCSAFIGESLHAVYNVNALYSDKSKSYLPISAWSASLGQTSQWKPIGAAFDQKVLAEAQQSANAKMAVIAVYKTADGIGHIALILPGELKYSGTWGFNVPNSASFVYSDPSKSFVNKGLSYAFARSMIKDITLYTRNY